MDTSITLRRQADQLSRVIHHESCLPQSKHVIAIRKEEEEKCLSAIFVELRKRPGLDNKEKVFHSIKHVIVIIQLYKEEMMCIGSL